ncbi:hypothetical protein HUF15_00560 [Streptomyces samsunensis]|uniref:hypothetical protein n=1 Tax=Streptomyces malaysiensis TaxID=92644 RepID=UPI001583D9CF|nr:hypothetical protein [Streptomyces samsunensis]NUH35272.1 hypothetical protein [Streptomyces samsunensis]
MALTVRLPVTLQVGDDHPSAEIGWVEFDVGDDTEEGLRCAVADLLRATAAVLENPGDDEEVTDAAAHG